MREGRKVIKGRKATVQEVNEHTFKCTNHFQTSKQATPTAPSPLVRATPTAPSPLTSLTEVDGGLFLDALGDVHCRSEAGHARVGGIGLYGSAALAAQTARGREGGGRGREGGREGK